MHMHREDEVRDRAYALWVEAGSPEGNDWQFWHEAERQLAAEESDIDPSLNGGEASEGTQFEGPQVH